jgi:Tfp pilus assembly protein PilE
VQAAQEKFFLQNNSYSANLAAAPPAGLGLSVESENRYYTIALALTGGGAGFNASAAPRAGGGQEADTACASFTINQNGTKGAVDAGGADHRELCWK